ncbi:hypothetical protein HYU22_03520 [Candidatus Woesearchaeota archaeon]|nr:hypothetical protein [Candidatus Woesearchaeota archaeon]
MTTSRNQLYQEALQEGLYYLALDDEKLRQRALVAGLYQRAFQLHAQGNSTLLDRLRHHQYLAKDPAAFGEMLERLLLNKDTNQPAGLSSLLELEEPAPYTEGSVVRELPLVQE